MIPEHGLIVLILQRTVTIDSIKKRKEKLRRSRKEKLLLVELEEHALIMLNELHHIFSYYSNTHYAKVGGVQSKEVDYMEFQFLSLSDWRLFVTPEEFAGYTEMIANSQL